MKTRRTLLLGATGFLGSAVLRQLSEQSSELTLLLRRDSALDSFHSKLCIAHGLIEDTLRLRQIIALHEIDCILHCAAGENESETHSLTGAVLRAAAASERKPRVIVPLRREAVLRYRTEAPARLQATFLRMPELFGVGNRNYLSGPGALFAQAALKLPLPMILRDRGVCDVNTAAAAMVKCSRDESAPHPMGEWIDVPATATGRELLLAVKAELESPLTLLTPLALQVRETFAWYRSQAERWRGRMPEQRLRLAA